MGSVKGVRLMLFVWLACVGFAAPAAAAPPAWSVDAGKSALTYVVDINGQKVTGKLGFTAAIMFDPGDLAHSSARITIDMTSSQSGDATRDAMLTKAPWFNAAEFPKAVYQASGFTAKGGNAYEAQGKLTLKGVTNDVPLPFTLTINGDTAVAKGETTLARRAFNIGQGKDFETDKPVALTVKVVVNVTARRAQ